MEPKSGSRTIKKSASGGALERKKTKQKKKKDKRKASVKGTESTDVPSPELDSEVQLDGDVALNTDQDGQSSPVGQVTRLPQLASHNSVSLTTHTPGTPSPGLLHPSSRHPAAGGGQHSSSSAPTTRPAPLASTLVTVTSGVVARVAHLNIKHRASKSRSSKTQAPKGSGKASRLKDRSGQGGQTKASEPAKAAGQGGSSGSAASNESLRWELAVEDVDQERERIAVYKMNRRKRYLAAAQAKGLGWAMNYNSQTNVTPLSEDSGVETACGSPGTTVAAGAYIDFSSMQTLRPHPAHRGLQEAFVEC